NLLEKEFARYVGVKYAIAVSNGTDALFLSYLALGITFSSKVVTTPLSFIATASTIVHAGAVPLFSDVCEDGNLDPDDILKLDDDYSAITVVHLFGKPAAMDDFVKIAREKGCYLIEDAAHAHGATYNGRKIGTFGDVATFSFYPTKIIAAGGWGGIIVTNDDSIAEKLRLLRAHGELKVLKGVPGAYEYVRLGYNMRMSEFEAAVAYFQLKEIDSIIKARIRAARILSELLQDVPGVSLPKVENCAKHVFYIYSILIDPKKVGWNRDDFVRALNAEGICARRGYHIPLHKTSLFRNINDVSVNHMARVVKYPDYRSLNLKKAESLAKKMVWLPMYPEISETELELVAKAIKKLIRWKSNSLI
ncbi:MAG: DegT/DnrJ/EryC1/StrS family aminotransferase, partial [Candidatus Njordarchaeota archaeon]